MTPLSCKNNLETRVSLLARLKDWDNQRGWQEFFDLYREFIFRVALRAGLTETEAEDAVQETVLAVARNIKGYRYDPTRCSFKSWLILITRQRIIWQLRQRLWRDLRGPESTTDPCRNYKVECIPDTNAVDLDSVWEEEWQRNLMHAALERVKQQVSPRHYQIFDLCVLQDWSPAEVARTLGISAPRVYLAKHRVSVLLAKEAKRQQREVLLKLSVSRGTHKTEPSTPGPT